jgi:hypothetical protein
VRWEVLGRSGQSRARGRITVAATAAGAFTGTLGEGPPKPGVSVAEIDAATGEFTLFDATGRVVARGDRFGAEEGVRLLEEAGVTSPPGDIRAAGLQLAEIASVDDAMAAAAMRPAVAFSGPPVLTEGSSTTSAVPSLPFTVFGAKSSWAPMILAAIVSAALYLFTLVWVVRRRKRLMRRVQRPAELSSLAGV